MAFVSRGVRRGQWADRYVGAKRPRLIVLGFIIASVGASLALLVGLGAPGELSGYVGVHHPDRHLPVINRSPAWESDTCRLLITGEGTTR